MLKDNIRHLILGLSLIVAVTIYACSTRYTVKTDRNFPQVLIVDRWTGNVTVRH